MTIRYKNLDKYLKARSEYASNPTASITQLSKKYQFDRISFSNWLQKNPVKTVAKKLYVSENTYNKQLLAAKDYVDNLLTIGQAAKKYSLSEKSFSMFLTDHKLKRKTFIRRNDLTYDKSYFKNIDTEEKAYWLGFIFADGCVFGKSKDDKQPNRLSIELSKKDIHHLEKFKKALHSNVDIKCRTRRYAKFKDTENASITHVCKELVKPLTEYGVIPNKTYLGFININIFDECPYLIRHFLRGYIDGDGWVNNKEIGFCVYSDEIFANLKFLISKIYDMNGFVEKRYTSKRSHINRLCIYRQREQLAFTKILYEDCTIYLDRKYKQAIQNITRLTNNMAADTRNCIVRSAELSEET